MGEDVVPSNEGLSVQELGQIADRRREGRRDDGRTVRVYCIDNTYRNATLSDCSPQGVSILLAEPIQADSQFMIPVKSDPVQMAAYTVRYWWRTSEGDYRIGAELEGVIGAPDEQDGEAALRSFFGSGEKH